MEEFFRGRKDMHQGKFISIEGVEGAGKSTIVQFVKKYLQDAGVDLELTREPGGTEIAEKIRLLLLHPDSEEKILPETELLLMFAGRVQHMQQCILPWLKKGKWIVADRFVDASYAYQGGGREIDLEFIKTLDKRVVGDVYPDLTILLDLPPEVGFERAVQRGMGKDRIEKEKMEFFKRVRNVYLQRAKEFPDRIVIVDASRSLEQVEKDIASILDACLKKSKTA
jgi:dTMP kinase